MRYAGVQFTLSRPYHTGQIPWQFTHFFAQAIASTPWGGEPMPMVQLRESSLTKHHKRERFLEDVGEVIRQSNFCPS